MVLVMSRGVAGDLRQVAASLVSSPSAQGGRAAPLSAA
jgi:hypothetical protein